MTTTVGSRAFRSDVQGLRAIAVGLVLLYHAGVPPFGGGYVGVDVFFVISGFLITSHLVTSIERDGRPHFAAFYARRARRILPASLVVLVATTLALPLLAPPLSLVGLLKDALATVLYLPNLWFAAQDTDYLADHTASPFQHYWSLGVEEQFYVFWPLILLALAGLARHRRGRLIVGVTVAATVSFIVCVLGTAWNQPLAFFLLPSRAWELLVGALVATMVLGRPPRLPSWIAFVGGWLGLAAVLAAGTLFDETTVFPGSAAAVPVLGTAAVIYCGSVRRPLGPTRLLSSQPFQAIGLISYSLYLVHWPLLMLPTMATGGEISLPLWQRVALGIGLAAPAAWLLHRFVEEPLRATPTLTRRPPRLTLIVTGVVTALLAFSITMAIPWAGGRTVSGQVSAPSAPETPRRPPVGTNYVPTNLSPTLRDADQDVPDVYGRAGCHLDVVATDVQDCRFGNPEGSFRVALFGDSHAAQWLPAIQRIAEDDGDLSISTYTKSSCPAVLVTVMVKNQPYAACDRWREAVLSRLADDPPDLVLISSYAYHPLASRSVGAERRQEWATGLRHTAERLRAVGSQVLVVADTPRFETAPPTCLSENVEKSGICAGAPSTSLDAQLLAAEQAATRESGASYIDLNPYLCDASSCPAVIGDLLVYRDVNHLTATFARYLAPTLQEQVEEARPG